MSCSPRVEQKTEIKKKKKTVFNLAYGLDVYLKFSAKSLWPSTRHRKHSVIINMKCVTRPHFATTNRPQDAGYVDGIKAWHASRVSRTGKLQYRLRPGQC